MAHGKFVVTQLTCRRGGTVKLVRFYTAPLCKGTVCSPADLVQQKADHEQRFPNEGCNKPKADRNGGTGAVERVTQGKAGGVWVEGSVESTLQRCDQRKGPGARHSGGPGHRSHTKRQSTRTRQCEERAPSENQSFSSSTRNFVNETNLV
ncbi:hypothetical protein Q5P01_018621 [Channa striata]|uniref:Uncharacterized protein n=1 Tax=Channa striata TaxID=64152 RepID=A0AA88S8L1_CHASR|nr:hypothetical protein Q5P01_018621 [Channa striata]